MCRHCIEQSRELDPVEHLLLQVCQPHVQFHSMALLMTVPTVTKASSTPEFVKTLFGHAAVADACGFPIAKYI